MAFEESPKVSQAVQEAIVSDINDFGLTVFKSVAAPGRNVNISPPSAYAALAMAYAGAKGATEREVAAVLFKNIPANEIHRATNHLLRRVAKYARPSKSLGGSDKYVEIQMAHEVFLQKGLTVTGPFLDTLSSQYDSGIELVDFKKGQRAASELINAWVARETNNRVQNLLGPAVLTPDTRFVLVDALYLYASWQTQFDPNLTAPQTFHGADRDVSVPFMDSTLDADYSRGADWSGVDIPYFGESLVFTAILPDSDHFGSVKASLDARWLALYDQSHSRRAVALTIPKFKIAGPALSWVPTLKSMGIKALFEQASCDLSGLTRDQPLFVDDVLQQTFIEVAEKGTEAAAATAVVGVKASAETEQPVSFVLDRPFMFFVREPRGPVLFAGQIMVLPGLH